MREKVTDSWPCNEPAKKSHTTWPWANSAQIPGFRARGFAMMAAEDRGLHSAWSARPPKWFGTGLMELQIFMSTRWTLATVAPGGKRKFLQQTFHSLRVG
jgi:hypothetical protein